MEKQSSMGPDKMSDPLYVCVYVPEFPAQTMLRLRGEMEKLPSVVLQGNAPLEQVCSVNRLAASLGVMHGMTRAELDSFEGLNILRRSVLEEHGVSKALLETANAFTPRVEIQKATASTFSMVLDMTGCNRIFGSTKQIVQRIAKAMQSLNIFVHLAASVNFHTAVCVAPIARRIPIIVPTGSEAQQLASLPLSTLDLSTHQANVLELWGLKTLRELACLQDLDLVVRLGQAGKRLLLLARGAHPHLMVPVEAVFTLEEFVEFEEPVELLDSLLSVLSFMLDQLIARAQNRALALASVTIKLKLNGGDEHKRTIKPTLPVVQQDILLKLLYLDLQAHPPSAAILGLHVNAETGDHCKTQLGLFATQLPEAMRLDVTLARIAAFVGEGRVGRAVLLDTHNLDGFVVERFLIQERKIKRITNATHSIAVRRCRPPLMIVMECNGRRPRAFLLRGKKYVVREAYGPWRKSGQWWSAEVWSREEWDVRGTADDETLLCILGHDLLRKCWQLDGLYD